MKTKTTV